MICEVRVAGGSAATAATGGALASGQFIQPTVFDEERNDTEIAQDEVIGPVPSITPFDADEEAAAICNDTRYGALDFLPAVKRSVGGREAPPNLGVMSASPSRRA